MPPPTTEYVKNESSRPDKVSNKVLTRFKTWYGK
jgi:hypothetical protein